MAFHKQFAAAKTLDKQSRIKRQIGATDQQIGHLVYKFYGLTDYEIKVIGI